MHTEIGFSSHGAHEQDGNWRVRRRSHTPHVTISARTAVLAEMKTDDLGGLEASYRAVNKSAHKAQHKSKVISVGMVVIQFFVLLRIANQPAADAARNLPRYEFEVDDCQHHSHDTLPSTSMHLRGGALSKEGYSLTEFSRASAFAPFARTVPRLSARCTSTAAAVCPPLHSSMPDPVLLQYREGRAAARMQHGRPPKLSRSVEVNY